MSRKQKIKHMTPEELKSKLYAHFQRNGSLDHMRAQLRGQLVTELFKVAEPLGPDTFPNSSDVGKFLLPLQVCNWLVYDHLFRQDYQYSLSTFVSEAQLPHPEKFLTAGVVIGLLGLSGQEFESICKLYSENNELGLLHSLLLAIIKAVFNVPNKDSALNAGPNLSFEINESSKKQILRNQEELSASFGGNKSQAFNDTSLLNESAISKKLSVDKSLIFNNTEKSVEISFHEQLQSVKEESEREVQKLRHRLLEELENLHKQEHKMQLEVEFTKAEHRKEQDRLIKEKEKLKEKEILLEKEIAHKFQIKMRDAEEDFASKLHRKDKELETLKAKLLEKEQKLMHANIELAGEKDSQKILKRDLEDLNHMYRIIQDKYSAVLDENTNLLKKFESMSDYSILKEELSSKSKEVLKLQHEVREIHQKSETERRKYVETVRRLEDTLSVKEPQLVQTQTELNQVRNTLEREEGIWNKDRKKLEQELNEFKELYKTMIQRIEGQDEDIQDLHKTIHTLNYKFTNNSVTRSETVPYKTFHKNSHTYLQYKPDTLFTKRSMSAQQDYEVYQDVPLQFLSDAKRRLCNLKKEEDKVQEKYSFIYGTIPENNTQTGAYFDNFNFTSVPKSTIEDYSSIFPKSSAGSPTLDKWSRNKLTNLKSPYSLDDVKRLVTHSLFPYKSNYQTNFDIDVTGSNTLSQTHNLINTRFKESETYSKLHKGSIINSPVSGSFTTDIIDRGNIPVTNDSVPYEACSKAKEQIEQSLLKSVHKEFTRENIEISKNVQDVYASSVSNDATQFHPKKAVTSSPVPSGLQEVYSKVKGTEQDKQPLFNPIQIQCMRRDTDSVQEGQTDDTPKNVMPLCLKESVASRSVIYGLHENHSNTEGLKQDKQLLFNPVQNEFLRNLDSSKDAEERELRTSAMSNDATPSHSQELEEIEKTSIDVHLKNTNTSQRENSNPVTDTSNQKMPGGILDESKNKLDSETTSAIFVNLDEAWKQGSSLTVPKSSNTYKDSFKNTDFMELSFLNGSKNQIISEPNDPVLQQTSSPVENQSLQQTKVSVSNVLGESSSIGIKSSTVNVPELELQMNNDNLDVEENKSTKSSEKVGNIDSASELSEIHLSCGSETEQQKEDSDVW